MIIVVNDVANHFNCDSLTAAKITRFLMRSSDVVMCEKGVIDFKFCGVTYSLTKTGTDWLMVRAVTVRGENVDDVLN